MNLRSKIRDGGRSGTAFFASTGTNKPICSLRWAALDVHNTDYIEGRAPLDYSSEYFVVLCRNCHQRRHRRQVAPNPQLELFSPEELSGLLRRPSSRESTFRSVGAAPTALRTMPQAARRR